jgi:hypothetical protein
MGNITSVVLTRPSSCLRIGALLLATGFLEFHCRNSGPVQCRPLIYGFRLRLRTLVQEIRWREMLHALEESTIPPRHSLSKPAGCET